MVFEGAFQNIVDYTVAPVKDLKYNGNSGQVYLSMEEVRNVPCSPVQDCSDRFALTDTLTITQTYTEKSALYILDLGNRVAEDSKSHQAWTLNNVFERDYWTDAVLSDPRLPFPGDDFMQGQTVYETITATGWKDFNLIVDGPVCCRDGFRGDFLRAQLDVSQTQRKNYSFTAHISEFPKHWDSYYQIWFEPVYFKFLRRYDDSDGTPSDNIRVFWQMREMPVQPPPPE